MEGGSAKLLLEDRMAVCLRFALYASTPARLYLPPFYELLLLFFIILRDETLNLRVMGRQPHPNPNFAAYTLSAAQPALRRQGTPRVCVCVWGGSLRKCLEGLLLLLAASGGGKQKR